MRGTIRRLGLEGGLWALITDDGKTYELVDVPDELKEDGRKAVVEGERPAGSDVSIGMVGESLRVKSFKLL